MKVEVKLIPSGVDEDGEDQFMDLDAAIISTLQPLLREAVQKKVDVAGVAEIKEIVREHVAKLSVDAFEQAFQATDHWGKKQGDPQTLAEIVSKEVTSYLDGKVDTHGESSYGSDRLSRCQWLVKAAIQTACEGEIDKRLTSLRAEFVEHLAAKIAKVTVS